MIDALMLVVSLAGPSPAPCAAAPGPVAHTAIPVAIVVDRGEFESKESEDLDRLANKLCERLSKGRVKQARFVTDPAEATVVVQLLSKEWQATGSTTTRLTSRTSSQTAADTAFGVYGAIVVGESTVPFNLRLSPEQVFNKDNTLSGKLDGHIEDFIKRNYDRLSALKK